MFQFIYTTREEDLNYGGHVGNERALLFFQMARMALFEKIGFSELNIGNDIGIIQKNAFVEYNKELFINNTISINIIKYEAQKVFFDLFYEIIFEGTTSITGSTRLVAFDYENKKIRKIPEEFHQKMINIFNK
ncbi:acyl-CoA thioesterase [Fusobacterium sp. PH5-44]|uniref:acyl-CoA thioesterase n=1 Tax=unclassified Fusobacterium TaxID=2648384 RepID=UPI003D254116